MWLKNNIKELIAAMMAAAFIVFTGLRWVPIEVFIGVAAAAVTYYFQERSKDSLKRRVAMLEGKSKNKGE